MRRKARNCPLCGVRMRNEGGKPDSKELDHIIPIAVGGTHTHGNVRIVCRRCNQRRPKDGSDSSGPVTLWAQGPIPVGRPDGRRERLANKQTCRKGLHPWIPANIKVETVNGKAKRTCRLCREDLERRKRNVVLRRCGCGALFPVPGRTLMCDDCTAAAGRRAAELHAAGGLTWDQVAEQVGYGTGEGARFAARRAGYVPSPRPVRAEPARPCPECGEQRPVRARWCAACTTAKAWQAAGMYQGGMPLQVLADQLGYDSVTSVSNLMKSVTTVSMRIGRPSKQRASL